MRSSDYRAFYDESVPPERFRRLSWEARRIMDQAVTGVDGVNKLARAAPVVPWAREAVDRCEAALIHQLWLRERDPGPAVTAVKSGSESVSYAQPTPWDPQALVAYMLSGVPDRNGVPLLYMGPYPQRPGEEACVRAR